MFDKSSTKRFIRKWEQKKREFKKAPQVKAESTWKLKLSFLLFKVKYITNTLSIPEMFWKFTKKKF